MDKGNETTFGGACKDFFGTKPGQGARDFYAEIMALNPDDRREIQAGLEANGYNIKAAA